MWYAGEFANISQCEVVSPKFPGSVETDLSNWVSQNSDVSKQMFAGVMC